MKKTLAIVVALSAFALAKSTVSIDVKSYQEVTKKDKSGKVLKVWDKVTKVVPNSVVKYVDTVTNNSNTTIKDVKIKNPVDKNLIFLKDSVKSKTKISVKYSIDGGKSFAETSKLFIKGKDGKKVLATAKDYNALLVNVNEVPANSKVKVEYKVKVK